jgi:sugar phosphate isomerase/epimerase
MKISLFSQSLFALPLTEAIKTTARIGFSAIELACTKPHFDLETAIKEPKSVAEQIQKTGLKVSALSLFNNFTDKSCLNAQVEEAKTYIRLAPLFDTKIFKMTPGPPGSARATEEHWRCLAIALDRLVPVAEEIGVRLAFETHMRQLTDTLSGTKQLLAMAKSDVVGLTVDFSNLTFSGEKMPEVISALEGRIYNTHIKNGTIDENDGWHFHALDTGLTDYSEVLSLLREINYTGYLTIECLGSDANEKPIETTKRDLDILRRYLEQVEH